MRYMTHPEKVQQHALRRGVQGDRLILPGRRSVRRDLTLGEQHAVSCLSDAGMMQLLDVDMQEPPSSERAVMSARWRNP